MKQDLKQEAMLEIKAFNELVYNNNNAYFEKLVKDMIPFLCNHLNAYIHSHVQFFKPIQANELIYRCRNTNEKLDTSKFSEFTAPEVKFTKDLRMSRKGTSYFYGALDDDTAKIEAIDPNRKYQYLAT